MRFLITTLAALCFASFVLAPPPAIDKPPQVAALPTAKITQVAALPPAKAEPPQTNTLPAESAPPEIWQCGYAWNPATGRWEYFCSYRPMGQRLASSCATGQCGVSVQAGVYADGGDDSSGGGRKHRVRGLLKRIFHRRAASGGGYG